VKFNELPFVIVIKSLCWSDVDARKPDCLHVQRLTLWLTSLAQLLPHEEELFSCSISMNFSSELSVRESLVIQLSQCFGFVLQG
jgi:hypothetical protein